MDKNDWTLVRPERAFTEPPKGPGLEKEKRAWLLAYFTWLRPDFSASDFDRIVKLCEESACEVAYEKKKCYSQAQLEWVTNGRVWIWFFKTIMKRAEPPESPFQSEVPPKARDTGEAEAPALTVYKRKRQESEKAKEALNKAGAGPTM